MSITLRQLQVFLAIARTENLSAAAQVLCMSKSAVSQSLGELEDRLGVTLFERMRGRLLLSAEGRRLKPAADEMMERTEDIESLFASKNLGQLRVACTLSVGSFLLADLLRDFQSRTGWLPEVRIANTAEVAESLLNFSTDVALIEGPVMNLELATETWLSDEMVVVAPRGHRLLEGTATWEQLSRERWILREEGSSTRVFFDAQFALKLNRPNIIASINSFETIVGMVVNGMGLTVISERVLQDPFYGTHLRRVDCPERFIRQLSFCLHRQKYQSSDMKTWMDFCRIWAQHRVEQDREKALERERAAFGF
ncbi:MAG: LysR substrate-binding domain-containing protein [Sutterella sp.]|nr:LysR substrate-binding domain-containing protein [Sutterella sp.]